MVEILVLRSWHVRDATKLLSGTAATSALEASANSSSKGRPGLASIDSNKARDNNLANPYLFDHVNT